VARDAPALRPPSRVPSTDGVRRFVRKHAVLLQIALAGALALLFALAVLVGNPGRIGARQTPRTTNIAVPRPGVNLFPNTSFQPGIAGRVPTGGASLASTASVAHRGKRSLKLTATGAVPTRYGAYTETGGNFPRHSVYVLSLWVRGSASTAGKPAEAVLVAFRNDGSRQALGAPTFRLGHGWRRVTVKGRVPHHGIELEADVIAFGDVALGDRFFLDDVTLKRIRSARRRR